MVGSEQILVAGELFTIGCAIISSGKTKSNKWCLLTFQIKSIHRYSSAMVCFNSTRSSIAKQVCPFHDGMSYNLGYGIYIYGGG